MDAFAALTVGASFRGSDHAASMRRFGGRGAKAGATASLLPLHGAAAPALLGDALATSDEAAVLAVPQPSATLDLFARAHDGAKDADDNDNGDTQGDHTTTADAATAADKALKPMSRKRMGNLWRKHDLHVTGVDVPAPIEHFSSLVRPPLNTPHHVVNNLFARQHRVPTPVQMQAIPCLIQHRDVLACAPTGSGKTLAFLVPLFALLQRPERAAGGVRALIVTPTMELAQQIEREAFFLTKGQRWRFVQHGQTTRDKDIFVATPGRVARMLQHGLLDLSHVQYLVFDEGDRLWDSATDFLDVVDAIVAACTRADKVVSLFTATLSEKVETAARSVMGADPVRIIVRGRQRANTSVRQRLVFCGSELGKIVAMRNLIREGIVPPVLVFVQSIERTRELYEEIRTHGLHIAVMNATMTVDERDAVVTQFRLGRVWVLVTTELLSRGIDFKNVGTVVNFDLPTTVDSYIHRVGRTGRAGKTGDAITFFTEDDRERLPGIARVMRESGSAVEDWMLQIRVDRATRARLARTTPHRMIVSTAKRMRVADARVERQYRRLEAASAAAKTTDATTKDGTSTTPRQQQQRRRRRRGRGGGGGDAREAGTDGRKHDDDDDTTHAAPRKRARRERAASAPHA